MKAPISVCMIVRNEKAYLRQCLEKIRPFVEEIVIVDTGSDDGTQEIAKEFADCFVNYDGCNGPLGSGESEGRIVDFADARNKSFEFATQSWVMWLDGDDEFFGVETLAERIKEWDLLRKNINYPVHVWIPYEHKNFLGNTELSYPRERFFSNKDGFVWRGYVHEACCLKGVSPKLPAPDGMEIIHRKRESGKVEFEPRRNTRILEYWLKKEGQIEPRMMFYLGSDYFFQGRMVEAEKTLLEYIKVSTNEIEKGMALSRLADLFIGKGDFDSAIEYGLKWISVQENLPEAYFVIAKAYYLKAHNQNNYRDWQKCAKFCDLGFGADMNQKPMFFDEIRRNLEIYFYYIRALGYVGRYAEGLKLVDKCIENYPLEPMFKEQKKFFDLKLAPVKEELKKFLEMRARSKEQGARSKESEVADGARQK